MINLAFKETEEVISLHGLGFIQVKLGAHQRLHVWHPGLPRRTCYQHSAIHDHRFSFTSLVLVGMQTNIVYRAHWCDDGDYTSYLHEGERSQFGNRPWVPDGALLLEQVYAEHIPAGKKYSMSAYVYHQTVPSGDEMVATLMTKTGEYQSGAHSTCLATELPDINFDRKQWPDDVLWEIVRDVLTHAA